MNGICYLSLIFWFSSLSLSAQDIIYLNNNSKIEGKITSIVDGKVRFKKLVNPTGPDYVLDQSTLHFIFFESGQFITFSQRESIIIKNLDLEHDHIFTSDNKLIKSNIIEQTAEKIRFKDINKPKGPFISMRVTDVQVILHKSGKHEILINPADAAYILKKYEKEIFATHVTKQEEISQKKVKEVDPDSIISNALNKYTQKERKEDTIEEFSYELYERRALEKTKQLGGYISLIADKSMASENVDNAIEQAIKLFISEESVVEVSNVNSNSKVRFPIRTYLTRLKLLPYDRIEITWSDVSYVSDLKPGDDGKYYGIITMQQKFSGFMEGNIVYEDVTQKNITVEVDLYDKVIDGETKKLWEVFLSEIGVVQTSA